MKRKKDIAPGVVIAYARVSTLEQANEGVSLQAQEAALRRYATAHDMNIDAFVVDAGVSGGLRLEQRPAGQELLARTRRGEVSMVIATKLDRLFRDALDALSITREWDANHVALHLVDQQIDTRTAIGKVFVAMLATVAELEKNLVGERTKAALAHLKAQGVVLGGEALEWTRSVDLDSGGRRILVPDANAAETIARIYQLHDGGTPNAGIALLMNWERRPTKRGGRWWPSTIAKILARRELDQERTRKVA
ncbi:MAG: recombinase family protein [Sandaracinaceae bacterium]|nr:recombinase family protein [Sandaracinaceae bacterium]